MARETTVGLIGAGNMGMGMARNLLKAGFSLVVCDIKEEPLRALHALGARTVNTPAEIGKQCSRVLAVVLDYTQVQGVVLGAHGLKETLQKGDIFIICSTIAPQQAQELGQILEREGIVVLDAPVSGGKEGAEAGTLSVMVGGQEAAFQQCRTLFEAIGKHIYYTGSLGNGERMKAINQLLVGVHLVATAEAVALAKKSGLDPQLMYKVITQSMGNSRVFEMKAPRMIEHDFQPRGALKIFLKDLGIVGDMAEEVGASVFLTPIARQLISTACHFGLGDVDDAAVVSVLEKLAGLEDS